MEKLIVAYTNEKATEILLPYSTVVDEFSSALKTGLAPAAAEGTLVGTFREIEAERIKYFAKEYILTRLEKIRRNLFVNREHMSARERAFADKYKDMMVRHSVYTEKTKEETAVIGFVAQKNLEAVKIDGQVVEVHAGDFFIASYGDVSQYISDGSITLV